MPRPIDLNRHRGLASGELTRRYRRTKGALGSQTAEPHEWDYDDDDWRDDYWDPMCGRREEDYLLFRAWEEVLGAAVKRVKIGDLLPASLLRAELPGAPDPPGPAEARSSFPPDELPGALHEHVELLISTMDRLAFVQSGRFLGALGRINGGLRGVEAAFGRFSDRPGVIVMSLLFAPFWVRPIASWRPPEGQGPEALVSSFVEHLFQIYPVPAALHRPWFANGLPTLKWVAWLILLGQGGSLRRAAPRFGWDVHGGFVQHFLTTPTGLRPLEACMWGEIARLGGSLVEIERICRHPGYALDPTEGTSGASRAYSKSDHENYHDAYDPHPCYPHVDRAEERDRERSRAFWWQTVKWLIRHRDRLTDEMCAPILDWAMHHHTESLRRGQAEGFSWSGRRPESAHRAALEYRRMLETPYQHLAWRPHGFDRDFDDGDATTWQIRELTSWSELAEEGSAMGHCVASYAHSCARGESAIFSFRSSGSGEVTVELDPNTRRILQARGTCNRAVTPDEQAVIGRWLQAIAPGGA